MPRNVYSLSCCPPKDNSQFLARHFSSALQSTYLAMRPHRIRASTPPWRMHREHRNSVSQFSKLADPWTSCISANRAAKTCMCSQFTSLSAPTAGVSIQTIPCLRAACPPKRSHHFNLRTPFSRSASDFQDLQAQNFPRIRARRTSVPPRAQIPSVDVAPFPLAGPLALFRSIPRACKKTLSTKNRHLTPL